MPLQGLRERLSELEAKLAALNEKYTDKHPLVVATKAEVDEAQDKIAPGPQGSAGPAARRNGRCWGRRSEPRCPSRWPTSRWSWPP